ncbi:MAG: NUDIX domain-containing protein [bacterium]|nr:NUDIX domain-containing protein [bacterium]
MNPSALVEPIKDAFYRMEYRPTVVMQIYNFHGALLLVQSAKNHFHWDMPQGGIEPSDEDLCMALFREAHEKLGVTKGELSFMDYSGFEDLNFPPQADKRGFTKGKRYFFARCLYHGGGLLNLEKDELSGYIWVDKKNQEAAVRTWLSRTQENKRELTLRHLFPKI